jgi:hypothetical protein
MLPDEKLIGRETQLLTDLARAGLTTASDWTEWHFRSTDIGQCKELGPLLPRYQLSIHFSMSIIAV